MIEETIYFWGLFLLPLVITLELVFCGIAWSAGREPGWEEKVDHLKDERTKKHAA